MAFPSHLFKSQTTFLKFMAALSITALYITVHNGIKGVKKNGCCIICCGASERAATVCVCVVVDVVYFTYGFCVAPFNPVTPWSDGACVSKKKKQVLPWVITKLISRGKLSRYHIDQNAEFITAVHQSQISP